MAMNPSTPGVYVEEIPLLPSSIAGVNTAIPAFIGYVEKAERNGQALLLNTPVRIDSMLDYESIFGKAESEVYTIDIDDNTNVSPTQRTIIVDRTMPGSKFRTYYNVQMYFANGGGPCYIVPVGFYFSPSGIDVNDFMSGLAGVAKVDEPTILLAPDALSLPTAADMKTVNDAALAQCQLLKDRVAILDLVDTGNIVTDRNNFRNNLVGADNLKYGAAYYPDLKTTLGFGIDLNQVSITSHKVNGMDVTQSLQVIDFSDAVNVTLTKVKEAMTIVKLAVSGLLPADIAMVPTLVGDALAEAIAVVTAGTSVTITAFATAKSQANTVATTEAVAADGAATTFAATPNAANATILLNSMNDFMAAATLTLTQTNTALNLVANDPTPANRFIAGSLAFLQLDNPVVFTTIMAQINTNQVTLNPSGAMAGIYARVDAERGVWKAPANVGVRSIIGPTMNMTNAQQGELNIDSVSGKSINGLRVFTGRGTLVWGARTLAGNDNEWRYINVRRLFNYVEESVAEATAFVVFEPNTANTWQRVSGMIESFLTGLWREGALAGSVPKDAFYVRVGLGTTMTAQDILEGRMIVEIGMAAVRPAEFIVLKFMHKLQES